MNYYKSLFVSSLIISGMLLFFLFNAYDGFQDYNGIKLYFSMILSTWIGFTLIGFLICVEILKWLSKATWPKFSLFIFSFSWLYNFYVFMIWLTSVLMGMQAPKREWWNAIICLIGGIVIFIYQKRSLKNINHKKNACPRYP